MLIRFKINGEDKQLDVEPTKILLDFLREDLGLTSVKRGCQIGECGACTVIIDSKAVNSCMVLTGQIHGCEIITTEGLQKDIKGKILQEAFLKAGAVQCGFCTPGMLMSIYALLKKDSMPDSYKVKEAIAGNLCRCTGYKQIVDSVNIYKKFILNKEAFL